MFVWNRAVKPGVQHVPSKNLKDFVGRYYNKDPAYNWGMFIKQPEGSINYLEIGVADGGNVIQVEKTFAKHPNSRLYCVDPWQDYEEYPEYKGYQDKAWETFNKNIDTISNRNKFVIHRGFSDKIVPTFKDNFFDLAFVDGNHETEFVYRDGLMTLQKTKKGGYIIFDDYCITWPQTMAGIDKFLNEKKNEIKIIHKGSNTCFQVIVQKL